MAFSYVTRSGNGTQKSFTFSFEGQDEGYLREEDLVVTVDGVSTSFTLTSSNTLELATAPPVGEDNVLIRRVMPKGVPYADFQRGNNFGQEVLNNSFLQLLYVVHELLDGYSITEIQNDLRFNGHKLLDVGEIQTDELTVQGNSVAGLAANAAQSAEDAEESASRVDLGALDNAVSDAQGYASDSEQSKILSGNYSVDSNQSALESEAYATEAEGYKNAAQSARDASFVNADVYADISSGLAATANGEQFQVVSEDEVIRYERVDATTANEVARYSSSSKIGNLEFSLPTTIKKALDITHGLSICEAGEFFSLSSYKGETIYSVFGNLFDPSAVVQDSYVNNSGIIGDAAGWARSEFIRVTPGSIISIGSNTTKRENLTFYTKDKEFSGKFDARLSNPLTVVVPDNAVYLIFNVESPSEPQPTEIMVNYGDPVPYTTYGSNTEVVESELYSSSMLSQVVETYQSDNLFIEGKVKESYLLTSVSPYTLGVAEGWGAYVVPVVEGDVLTIYSPSGISRRAGAAFFSTVDPKDGDTSVDSVYYGTTGVLTVTAPTGALSLVINVKSPSDPIPSDLMIVRGSTQIPYVQGGDLLFIKKEKILPEVTEGGGSEDKDLTLTYNGTPGSFSSVESISGLTRRFVANPEQNPLSFPARFNLRADLVDGVTLRDGADDIAPDHIDGATVGANHGYALGVCTSSGHGKAVGDAGSVWTNGGFNYVLADVPDANTVLLARADTNTSVPTGTYTHVSGATNTADIVVSSVDMSQWYPPHNNWSVLAIADGKEVSPSSIPKQADKVQFVEQADILARQDIIDAWIADGGMPAGYQPNAPASMAQTLTYTYDKRGQITIARDWLTVKDILVSDLMGLQFARNGDEIEYIIPGSVPFLYNGVTLDYSMGEPADYTIASGDSIIMNSARLQASGEYAHRVLVVYPDVIFAIGLLPVGDAAYDVRRARTSAFAMEIRGNTGKLYFRVLDIGDHTSVVGDQYSAIGYRYIIPKSTERTAFYAVEGGGATWVYADWHNKSGQDRLPIDVEYPELIGKSFEIVESRNVTAKAGIIAGPLSVVVDAASTSATLVLKVS